MAVVIAAFSVTIYHGINCTEKYLSKPRTTKLTNEPIDKFPGLRLSLCKELKFYEE